MIVSQASRRKCARITVPWKKRHTREQNDSTTKEKIGKMQSFDNDGVPGLVGSLQLILTDMRKLEDQEWWNHMLFQE